MPNKQVSLYINRGSLKGTKLSIQMGGKVRPTKSVVKEAVFNTIHQMVVDSTFIECFAGSGIVGFEAASVGAKEVLFFEEEKETLLTLEKNISLLKSKCESCRMQAIGGNFFTKFRDILPLSGDFVLYIDPPFSIRDGYRDIYDKVTDLVCSLGKVSEGGGVAVLEFMSGVVVPSELGGFKLYKKSKFGRTSLAYYIS